MAAVFFNAIYYYILTLLLANRTLQSRKRGYLRIGGEKKKACLGNDNYEYDLWAR